MSIRLTRVNIAVLLRDINRAYELISVEYDTYHLVLEGLSWSAGDVHLREIRRLRNVIRQKEWKMRRLSKLLLCLENNCDINLVVDLINQF